MASPPPPVKAGYYARPSAAFEQGGGFYVPGLEGPRLRLAAATVLSTGLVMNRFLSPGTPQPSQMISELLGAAGCLYIVVQVAVASKAKQQADMERFRAMRASRLEEQKFIDEESLDADSSRRAQWAANSLLSLTPARAVVWVDAALKGKQQEGEPRVLLRFGRFSENLEDGCCLTPLFECLGDKDMVSLGGPDFPIPRPPQSPLPSNAESVLLLRTSAKGVLVIASEQTDAFSEKHGLWAAQIADYLVLR